MRRFLVPTMVICGLLVLAVPVWAVTINGGTDVGSIDPLLASTELANSGFATELAWVQGAIGDPNATLTVFDAGNYSWVEADGVNDIWVSALQDSPDYFFLKTGASPGTDDHFLFTNLADLTYAVVDFGAAGVDIRNIGAISHVGETGGGTSVPEPGTLMLLGGGLVGLALYGRKSFKR